jgi:hypothetical protein
MVGRGAATLHRALLSVPHYGESYAAHYAAVYSGYRLGRSIAAVTANRFVGTLTPNLLAAIYVLTSAQDLLMAYNTEQHIWDEHKQDAEAIIDALAPSLSRVRYRTEKRRAISDERTIVSAHPPGPAPGRWLLIGLKFLPHHRSRSRQDEAWVTTAYFINETELHRQIRQQHLSPLP